MGQYLALLHGRRPRILDVLGAHVFAAFLTGYILSMSLLEWPVTLYMTVLVWGLAAGVVTHATEATRAAWRALHSRMAVAIYGVAHLLIVPMACFWLIPEDPWTIILLNMTMLAKLMLFIAGAPLRGPE